jgi:hypothetical protein
MQGRKGPADDVVGSRRSGSRCGSGEASAQLERWIEVLQLPPRHAASISDGASTKLAASGRRASQLGSIGPQL